MTIEGRVTADRREAVIAQEVLGENGASPVRTRIEVVVATGFTGYLTLPNDTAASLGLAPRGSRDAVLADGRTVDLNVYRAGRLAWTGTAGPGAWSRGVAPSRHGPPLRQRAQDQGGGWWRGPLRGVALESPPRAFSCPGCPLPRELDGRVYLDLNKSLPS